METIQSRIGRQKAFSKKSQGTAIFIKQIESLTRLHGIPKVKPLNQYDFTVELYNYLDTAIDAHNIIWAHREGIEDDSIPYIMPYFGIAEHSAYLGGDVQMESNTSYLRPFLKDLNNIERILLDTSNAWYRMLMDSLNI